MKENKDKKQQLSKIDIFKGKLDEVFIKKGLEPPVWKEKKGCGAYFPRKNKN